MTVPASPSGSSVSLPDSNALLALPDGPISPDSVDAKSFTISLIGGYPTFPALRKAPEVIKCGVCHQAIPLLAQVYCPPENGANDRTVYVWACPRPRCQRRAGSVRAFRASVRNEEYARDAAEKQAQAEKEAAEAKERARKNPFSVSQPFSVVHSSSQMPDTSAPSLFGSAQPLFGASASNPFAAPASESSATPDIASLSLNEIASSSSSFAPPVPAYQPAQYLNTVDEYLPDPEDEDMDGDDSDDETPEQKQEWKDERWEQLLPGHIDEVFERFVRRLQNADGAANQVLRYDLGGVPLPYSSKSPSYLKFFPNAPTARTADEEEDPDFAQYYSTAKVPPCPRCGGQRVFELQLVPSLISILQPDTLTTTGLPAAKKKASQLTEEERKKQLAMVAMNLRDANGTEAEVGDMEWGNVLVFGCENDCEGFGEEFVEVEWEAQLSEARPPPPPSIVSK